MNSSYYAVIFTSQRNVVDNQEYEKMAETMVQLAHNQKGFLGIESCRGIDGYGITVSYWQNQEDIVNWKVNTEHQIAQEFGRSKWYDRFTTRICKVEREYSFEKEK